MSETSVAGHRRRIVVTGASGTVGDALLRLLDDRFDVEGVDRRRPAHPVPGRPVRRADLRRARTTRRAVEGADTVVHLARMKGAPMSLRDAQEVNLRLTQRVLEAAAACGVRRVVLASSNHVVGGYESDEPYRSILAGDRTGHDPQAVPRLTATVPVRPDSAYGAGKVAEEAAARVFAEELGLSVLALRIGTVRPLDRPQSPRHLATLLTHRDLAQLVERCIDAADAIRYATFYGVSANTWRIWDIEAARAAIDYAPSDDAEAWASMLDEA